MLILEMDKFIAFTALLKKSYLLFGGTPLFYTLIDKCQRLDKQELYKLVNKYLQGKANQEEIDLLSRYYNSFQQSRNWNIMELGEASDTETVLFARIEERIKANKNLESTETSQVIEKHAAVKVSRPGQKAKLLTFIKIASAACVITIFTVGMVRWFSGNQTKTATKTSTTFKVFKNDVSPGGDRAILKLADGSTIVLDSAKNGLLGKQGNSQIINLNGKLQYQASAATTEILYNTISTPRGGKYQITLADGSLVWLNAASSLRYPASFAAKERRVEIKGEAYFEVAKNKASPFIVSVNGSEVQVLGTHFNVMAYSDEGSIETSLLEGSVKFVEAQTVTKLNPGQQSRLFKNGEVKVADGVNMDEVVAWKNGMFVFQGQNIETVLRQLKRWYEIEVVYEQPVNDLFYAKIPRSTNLSQVLKLLELTGKVHFEINGKSVIVKT